jgi:hypothetical protein
MNTGIRRFILRVAVGLLAFLLGVAVVWALGGINPFQGSSGSYRKNCVNASRFSRTITSTSSDSNAVTYETYTHHESGRSCKTKRMFRAMPPPPPPPAAPVAPAD